MVPALCAGLCETLRHSVLAPGDLPFDLGTPIAVALVLAISNGFARVSFGIIRRTEARPRARNQELEALTRRVERLAVLEERERLAREIHDSVAQGLASLLVRLDVVEALAERGRVAEVSGEARALRVPGTRIALLSRPSKLPGPSWSLPAGPACPYRINGPNTICGSCYADDVGRYSQSQIKRAQWARFEWTRQCLPTLEGMETFVATMVEAIDATGYASMRVHDSGDLFSPAYTRAWIRIRNALS